jgi:hypothetical protein
MFLKDFLLWENMHQLPFSSGQFTGIKNVRGITISANLKHCTHKTELSTPPPPTPVNYVPLPVSMTLNYLA